MTWVGLIPKPTRVVTILNADLEARKQPRPHRTTRPVERWVRLCFGAQSGCDGGGLHPSGQSRLLTDFQLFVQMDLSIIIINWNGLAVLRNCLNSIFGTSHGIRLEVIVVDNASQDDSVAMLQREFPQVVILRNQQNRGFAAANNQAFA